MTSWTSPFAGADHLPLRGVYVARRNALKARMPRFQLIPRKPVGLPNGATSTLLTEFGWVDDSMTKAHVDELSTRFASLAYHEYFTNEFREAQPMRYVDGHPFPQKQLPLDGTVPVPPELRSGVLARVQRIWRRRFRSMPWFMTPAKRLAAVAGIANLERALQAAWNYAEPKEPGESATLTFRPDDLGANHWKAFWNDSYESYFQPLPRFVKPRHHATIKTVFSHIATAYLGTGPALAEIQLAGDDPSAHQAIEDAVILEKFRLTPEMIAADELPAFLQK